MRFSSLIYLLWFIVSSTHAYINHATKAHYFDCTSLPGLSRKQMEICKRNRHAMRAVASGLRNAVQECEVLFANEKWNCPLNQGIGLIPLKTPTKESAFIHALFAGAVSHSIAKACSEGQIPDCQCGEQPRKAEKDFIWAGCNHNVRYGNRFSRQFVDASEKHKMDSRALMNLHNNRVGRKLLYANMQTKCKCHGVSGSCVTKTCWRSVPELDEFAAILKHKYERAQQVTLVPEKEGLSLILKPASGRTERYINVRLTATSIPPTSYSINNQFPANKGELVFLEVSPDFCVPNPKQEIQGTSGRECFTETQCHNLCCGRGWKVVHEWVSENCRPKFNQQTFNVEFETCTKLIQRLFCR